MKEFDCIYCESKFPTKGDLERHVKSHMGTRDFICELCHKTFTRQQTLNEHMNRHYGLKPYECKVCGKAFSEMSTVYKHIKIHEQQDNVLELVEEQVLVREVPSLQLTDIVHAEVEDIGEDLVEDGLVIQAGGSHGAKEEQGKEEEQFI